MFLRDVHREGSYNDLQNALQYLRGNMEKSSETLRGLVEREYVRFVKSKSLLDSVLDQIDATGFNDEKGWGVETIKANIDDASAKATVVLKPVLDYQKKETRLKSALKLVDKNKYLFNLPSNILRHIKDEN